MTDYRMPAAFQVDLTTGMFPNPVNLIERHLSDMGGYYADKMIASFAGMMPAQDPAFVCVVVVDDPRIPSLKHQGGLIAAPIFKKVATRVAAHMNLQPTEPVTTPLAASSR